MEYLHFSRSLANREAERQRKHQVARSLYWGYPKRGDKSLIQINAVPAQRAADRSHTSESSGAIEVVPAPFPKKAQTQGLMNIECV